MSSKSLYFQSVITLLLLILFPLISFCQKNDSTSYLITRTKEHIKAQEFEEALMTIRVIFQKSEVIPDEVVFLYGKTMYKLKNYVPAREGLTKYLSLQDKSGEYGKECAVLLDSVNLNICVYCDNTGLREVETDCSSCSGTGVKEITCTTCTAKGTTVCTICKGHGFLSDAGSFGNFFKKCMACEGKGYTNCKKCDARKKVKLPCDLCQGKGKVKVKDPCSHNH